MPGMRQYARVRPTFWTGPTGKLLRARGRDAQVLGLYLFTGPQATMTGLYYLSLPTLCHEAGFELEAARAALQVLAQVGFAYYDDAAELVWIPMMARYQIGEQLVRSDHRWRHVCTTLQQFANHRFGREFYRTYKAVYALPAMDFRKGLRSPLQAPSKQGEGEGEGEGNNPTPLPPPQDGAGDFELLPTPDTIDGNGHRPADHLSPKAKAQRVDDLKRYAIHVGFRPQRDDMRRIRELVEAGHSLAELQRGIDEAKARGQPKLYPRQPVNR